MEIAKYRMELDEHTDAMEENETRVTIELGTNDAKHPVNDWCCDKEEKESIVLIGEVLREKIDTNLLTEEERERLFPEEGKIRWRKGLKRRLIAEGKTYEHYENRLQNLAINLTKDILGIDTSKIPPLLIEFIQTELTKYFHQDKG